MRVCVCTCVLVLGLLWQYTTRGYPPCAFGAVPLQPLHWLVFVVRFTVAGITNSSFQGAPSGTPFVLRLGQEGPSVPLLSCLLSCLL